MIINKSKNQLSFNCGNQSICFDDENGMLSALNGPGFGMTCKGISADIGADGAYAAGSLKFQSFQNFKTWRLPDIEPLSTGHPPVFTGYSTSDNALTMSYALGALNVDLHCREIAGTPCIDMTVTNVSGQDIWINGTSLDLAFEIASPEHLRFDFPGNVPYGEYLMADMQDYKPVQTGLVNAVTHLRLGEDHVNLIYINEDEKWSTAMYRQGERLLHFIILAATEMTLKPGEAYHCGRLYFQLAGKGDYFTPIRSFYKDMGWEIPADGVKDAIIYSCHPKGTMDTRFPLTHTMKDFEQFLPALAKMGVDTIWLLPIFDHYELDDRDRNVYTPSDQSVIDHRYGTDEDVRSYVNHAKELGMRVIFDYVPHGPRPWDPLGKAHLNDWASLAKNGEHQIEWTCLSFDMANPAYLDYHYELVKDHISRFGIGGTRIDCAMGGLSNWRPHGGNRPSNSNMKGGVLMSGAIRKAFTDSGVTPFVTPENFHPIPLYNSCTDAYYDMALYRVLFDLNRARLSPEAYVFELTRWLDHQLRSTPEGLLKMRFLGNHDTVSWVWDEARATKIYGTERAKAMWVLITLIDGCPMIYQGDERPEFYLNHTAPVLEDFFAELFSVKKAYAGNSWGTEYLYTGTGIFAAIRTRQNDKRLLLINLDTKPLAYTPDRMGKRLYGNSTVQGQEILLEHNAYIFFEYH